MTNSCKSSTFEESDILQFVNNTYSTIATEGATPQYAEAVAKSFGYSIEELNAIPEESHMGLGCGNPTARATIREGENVLDLGSGGGVDVFLAAQKVGPQGHIIGLDMSMKMIERARATAKKRELYPPHVSFIHANLTESLPIKSDSIDCILSNCVINLLPESGKVSIFKEIYRVLQPGGRVVLDDIVAKSPLPADISSSITRYVGCVGGAVEVPEYTQFLSTAGFKEPVFVDRKADLNVYLLAAKIEAESDDASESKGSCCGGGSQKVRVDEANHLASLASQSPRIDLNEWAASYEIYTVKPGKKTESREGIQEPLERWWDAFPVPNTEGLANVSVSELAEMLLKNLEDQNSAYVIDVRRDDRGGGHIKGSLNWPAQTFYNELEAFHEKVKTSKHVVFHCQSSNGRGPRCAGWYRQYLNEQRRGSGPNVCVLEGGIKAWLKSEYGRGNDKFTEY